MKNMYLVGLSAILSMSVAAGCTADPDSSGQENDKTSTHDLNGDSEPSRPDQARPDQARPDDGTGPAPTPIPEEPTRDPFCKPLTGPASGVGAGVANPASVYCTELGYVVEGGSCKFSDGTSCEPWAFFRGECGASHSFCNRQGGQVSAKTEDMGGWTGTYALCTLPSGVSCKEQDFAASCRCE